MKNKNLLIVDDTETNIDILVELLGNHYEIIVALDGLTALEIVEEYPIDLILLDIMMPGIDGYQVCKKLKAEERTRDIPIIFISGLNETFDKVKAFSLGGVDYISKPFQAEWSDRPGCRPPGSRRDPIG